MLNLLKEKSKFVYKETLKIHQISPSTRIASSLSCVEILTSLYYGGLINFNPNNLFDDDRDRVIISKGHGSISLYPILADLGFFSMKELINVGKEGSFLGTIPDPTIPGYETVNGSLGHGLGVGAGIGIALKKQDKSSNVIVLCGDGEMYEGSNWEAIMFSAEHKLDNLVLIIDLNKVSMLDFTKNIINLKPLAQKFEIFGWEVVEIVNGHDIGEVYNKLKITIESKNKKPKVVIVNTIKGHGIAELENNPLSHIISLTKDRIEEIIKGLENE
ncbi:transketolase [Campylobacter sp. IFREMER_LSEM_CL2127]|uniref:transketolase n=1 Tax=Campylobacter sp. IFREMER_LSEM_CL2127 TaxID=2911619 RepID=UPI0021E6C9E7|nr:transketolase [Campylobacter sp. IFREMER_LSEM_CL2127]MCV3345711.1 transketolase [Campylobacter lari]MCV3381249.1 transketolase [Campylobacter sp. IFREMER_LSEM_CL2127]